MIAAKDKRWLEVAKKVAAQSRHKSYRIGTILTSGGRIISSGVNSEGPPKFWIDPLQWQGKHSEVACLTGIDKKAAKGSTIYVAGVSVAGNMILSRPCKSCEKVIENMGVRRVIYHTKSGEICEYRVGESHG